MPSESFAVAPPQASEAPRSVAGGEAGGDDGGKYQGSSGRRRPLIALLVLVGLVGLAVTLYFAISQAVETTPQPPPADNSPSYLPVSDSMRVTCMPDFYGKAELRLECKLRDCVWDETPNATVPCYLDPARPRGHYVVRRKLTNMTFGDELHLEWTPKGKRSLFGDALERLVVQVHYHGVEMFRIKIKDEEGKRYQVPTELSLPTAARRDNQRYAVHTAEENQRFTVQVKRADTGAVIFDTGISDLLFEDQFITLSTALPSQNIYGFGENIHPNFRHNTSYKSWPMWARDQPVSWQPGANLYGVHPFYMCIEANGSSHGVFLLNSNAMDYSFTPHPILTYRTIGGILDFFFFLGPTPENVVQQYTGVIGRPVMPPYWGLGFHLCRYGYKNTADLKAAVDRTRDADIPHDVQYADIDYMMDNKDFTISAEFADLKNYFTALRSNGTRTVIMLDPALVANDNYPPYKAGKDQSIFIKWPANATRCKDCNDSYDNMLGFVWPSEKVVFPDFFNNKTRQLWKDWIVKFHGELPFDGLWIDMNEPANFGTNEAGPIFNWPNLPAWSLKCDMTEKLENPQYKTMAVYAHSRNGHISDKTVCMVGVHTDGVTTYRHYDVHNLYGWKQTPITSEALRAVNGGKRGMVITRSTYPGSGKYAGHWLGDNESRWKDLRDSIIGMLEFNLFGIPYVGADICGFFENATAELCQRWMELGAFYPYSRGHNQKEAYNEDPGSFQDLRVATAGRNAMKIRYQLLPYLYTLFHLAHTNGDTVVRSLAQEWPDDQTALSWDEQFLWGPALLVSPILYQDQKTLSYYLPQGVWYNFYYGHAEPSGLRVMDVNRETRIQLHVRGGHILPMKVSGSKNTDSSRQSPFSLIVALDEDGQAYGQLFWDDGDSIDTYESGAYVLYTFISKQGSLWMRRTGNHTFSHHDGPTAMLLSSVTVMGVKSRPNFVYAGAKRHFSYSYDAGSAKLIVHNLKLDLAISGNDEFEALKLTWSDSDRDFAPGLIDCLPHMPAELQTEDECVRIAGCVWNAAVSVSNSKAPWCSLDDSTYNYTVSVITSAAAQTNVTLRWASESRRPYSFVTPDSAPVLVIEEHSSSVLHFKFVLSTGPQYEIPRQLPAAAADGAEKLYLYNYTGPNERFHFKVYRKGGSKALFDTSIGGLFLSKQFQQIVTRLASVNVYGFGENDHPTLKLSNDYETWPMFARDQPPGAGHSNLYGVHPFYLVIDDADGKAHGVLLWNSNAMEYKLQPDPSLTLRTIGGVLDFYMFLGPTPDAVIQQYTSLIGKPLLPPYWSLGFQQCKYGYNSLEELKAAVDRTVGAGIPLDVQYADIDHMDEQKDFTVNETAFGQQKLKSYVNQIKTQGIKFIIILDPALLVNDTYLPYARGKQQDIYVKWPQNYKQDSGITGTQAMAGYVWPNGYAVFPDFFHPKTHEFWKNETVSHWKNLPFDGLWIDMNEPANFGTDEDRPWNWPEDRVPWWSLKCPKDNVYDNPPYKPRAIFGNTLADKTLCMVAEQRNGELRHYDVHNLYGWSQSQPTQAALQEATGKRGIVISRSTFPGSGQFVGHWLGDNSATWRHMKESIIGMIEFNLFGIPYIGADVCGFFGEPEPELCQRWMQLGAFYPYSRNHNGLGNKPQDPATFGPSVAASSKKALDTRYHLLPYLYTLFYEAHQLGTPVVKALWHEFPADPKTLDIDEQFLWGKHLLITPVLKRGRTTVDGYFPEGKWYNYYTGAVETAQGQVYKLLDAPRDTIPLHVRGGAILPRQAPANNTHFSRLNEMDLLVALDSTPQATGSLFWDDGESKDTVTSGTYYLATFTITLTSASANSSSWNLTIAVNNQHSSVTLPKLDKVILYGVRDSSVSGLGERVHYCSVNKNLPTANTAMALNCGDVPIRSAI